MAGEGEEAERSAGPALWTKAGLQRLIRRLADLPLDLVLSEWVLRWEPDPSRPPPRVLTTPERLARIRADLAAGRRSESARLIRGVLDGAVAGDRALAEFLAGRRSDLPGPRIDPRVWLGRALQDPFLAPDGYPRRLPQALARFDLMRAGRPVRVGEAEAAVAMLGYLFSDPDYRPLGGGWAPVPFEQAPAMASVLGLAAAAVPDHPRAEAWMAQALAEVRAALARTVPRPLASDGREARAAAAVPRVDRLLGTLSASLPLMRAAQNARLADPFRWPEVGAAMEFLRALHSPPDPRLGRPVLAALGPGTGWAEEVGRLFGVAAAGVAGSDPWLARRWMALYRDYYGRRGSGDLAADVLLADPDLEPAEAAVLRWPSGAWSGVGAVLRGREAMALVRCGAAPERGLGDAMSVAFWGAGAPIAPGWHAPADVPLAAEHMHNRVTLGAEENMDAPGRLLLFREAPEAAVALVEARSTTLRRMPARPEEADPAEARPRRRLARPARYRRWVVLVRHPDREAPGEGGLADYLVLGDEVASTEPATFNLFVLARRVRRSGRRFLFEGQLSADAVLYLAAPEPEDVLLGEWGWPDGGRRAMIPPGFEPGRETWTAGEVQQVVRVRAPAGPSAGREPTGRTFLAVLYAFPKGGRVPRFEPLAGGRGVRVTLGPWAEEVYVASEPAPGVGGRVVVRRGGRTHVLVGMSGKGP